MPITDDPTLCDDLLGALRTANRASDHSLGHRARAVVRDLIHDLALRSRLRLAIDTAIAAGDPLEAHRLRRIGGHRLGRGWAGRIAGRIVSGGLSGGAQRGPLCTVCVHCVYAGSGVKRQKPYFFRLLYARVLYFLV